MADEIASEYSANPWIFYARELEFVAGYIGGSINAADELLLQSLRERAEFQHPLQLGPVPSRGTLRWTCQALDFGKGPDRAQLEEIKKTLLKMRRGEEAIESYLGHALEFFWRLSEHIKNDRTDHSATYIGSPWIVESSSQLEFIDGKLVPVENCWPVFLDGQPAVIIRAPLVRLYHNDVVATLRRACLLLSQLQAPMRPSTPEEWLVRARELPRRPGESRPQWVDRLYELHLQAELSKHWTKPTLSRRLYDKT